MEKIWEVIKIVLPAIFSGFITFFITKYTYKRNIPLDKLEISYNRVYYPIYKLLKSETDKIIIRDKVLCYIKKYNKYVDISTVNAFKDFQDNFEDNKSYTNFKNNIYNLNSSLRRRLGYLESNLFSIYRYMSTKEKRLIRFAFEVLCIYISMTLYLWKIEIVSKISFYAFATLLMIILGEVVMIIFSGIGSVVKNIKRHFR